MLNLILIVWDIFITIKLIQLVMKFSFSQYKYVIKKIVSLCTERP